jgi:hypothetical protein
VKEMEEKEESCKNRGRNASVDEASVGDSWDYRRESMEIVETS